MLAVGAPLRGALAPTRRAHRTKGGPQKGRRTGESERAYATSGGSFRAEKPRLLSDARFEPRVVGPSFDVHPDGDRFALARAAVDTKSSRNHVTLIFNFFDELRRVAP